MRGNMDEKYDLLGKDTTVADLVKIAAHELLENGLDAFDFDIPGVGPEGFFVLHFEASIQKAENC